MVTMPQAGSSPSIQELLAGVGFPVTKEQLLDNFQQNGATQLLLDAIRNASPTRFASADEVMTAIRNR
ncbi:MAG: DUF2795 domain-containing protein [Chloroflexota bacterium]|nr:DUF2795 domain-containing protein [Chloroflexota bacterium]